MKPRHCVWIICSRIVIWNYNCLYIISYLKPHTQFKKTLFGIKQSNLWHAEKNKQVYIYIYISFSLSTSPPLSLSLSLSHTHTLFRSLSLTLSFYIYIERESGRDRDCEERNVARVHVWRDILKDVYLWMY